MEKKQEYLFDYYSNNYHQTLNETLSLTGETTDYFANQRVSWMKNKINNYFPELAINNILDFGCGTGDTLPILGQHFGAKMLIGVDSSAESIKVAKDSHQSNKISFFESSSFNEFLSCDLVYCNGVFHHIPIEERDIALQYIHNTLTTNGIFAFWENNPINPGTRYLMRKCPFDNDAQPISALNGKRLLEKNGFRLISNSFCFIFPNSLRFLRFTERILSPLPIGAQYLLLAQKI